MVRVRSVWAMNQETHHTVTRLGSMSASLAGVGVRRQVEKSVELHHQEVQMTRMKEITIIY